MRDLMATYKQACIHCHTLIERGSRVCPSCGHRNPFGVHCPACAKPVERGQPSCPACGRSLVAACPNCKQQTFVDERCDACGAGLTVRCTNPRCGEWQFFENTKCVVCGHNINRER